MDLGDLLNKTLRKLQEVVYAKIAVERKIAPEGYLSKELKNLSDFSFSSSRKLREEGLVDEALHAELLRATAKRIQEMPLENLILAVLHIVKEIKQARKPQVISPDDIVGERAVGLGWISLEQLQEAQERQLLWATQGLYIPIGDILVELGFLDPQKYKQLKKDKELLSSPIPGYSVLRKVGQGAMGVVYKAIFTRNGQEVALKVLLPKHAQNPDDLARFLRSAHLSLDLNHPNLIRTYDVGKCENFYYQAMEFVRGESVLEYMKRHGPMDEVICLTIVAEVAAALGYLNSKGLVHRDVKPHNIMMTHMGEIKLTDLGIMRDQEGKHMITERGISIGSPHYISPEQAMGKPVDIRSDFYSLGATMYHMLTGEYPYSGRSGPEVLYHQVHSPPPDPRRKRPDISEKTAGIVKKLMAKRPEHRFQRAGELIQTIREHLKSLT